MAGKESSPDGDHLTLLSGRWPTEQKLRPEDFPPALVLTEADRALASRIGLGRVLVSTRVGAELFELLLTSGPDGIALAMQVPTAPNQFKQPYILMEAESGNQREEVVRDVQFHLMGRVTEEALLSTDWPAI